MTKDYFQDILPPSGNRPNKIPIRSQNEPTQDQGAEKSIRNISMPTRHVLPRNGARIAIKPPVQNKIPMMIGGKKSKWIWAVAGVAFLILGVLVLFAFRKTTITILPTSKPVSFDQSSRFVAYPELGATEGALTYKLIESDIEDSEVVPSTGTENVSVRASGTVTVFNEYSTESVRLVKNTRFSTSEKLIFRAPAEVVVPGKKGNSPGSVSITVVADMPGTSYNIGPVDRFVIPGLKANREMYTKVYARSASEMTGGFTGLRAAVDVSALESVRQDIRGRLETKARESARALLSDSAVVFPDLIRISYKSLPNTDEAGGGVRIHERAHVQIPLFPERLVAEAIANASGISISDSEFLLRQIEGLTAHASPDASMSTIGEDPLQFTLSGDVQLVWKVDSVKLAASLVSKNEGQFEVIVKAYPSIQEARARIQPFWKSTFPSNVSDMRIVVAAPETTK